MLSKELSPNMDSFPDESEWYEITLKGEITPSLLHLMNDMQLYQTPDQKLITLVGELPDQSALLGLLNALNNTRHEILSVRVLHNPK